MEQLMKRLQDAGYVEVFSAKIAESKVKISNLSIWVVVLCYKTFAQLLTIEELYIYIWSVHWIVQFIATYVLFWMNVLFGRNTVQLQLLMVEQRDVYTGHWSDIFSFK